MNGFCSVCLPWLSPPALPPSLPPSLIPQTESVRAKLHLGVLQPLCLSGWFTLHWPGLGLPGPHYQLPATGTHCSWQTQGRGTPHRNSCSGKRGWGEEVFYTAPAPGPGPNSIHAFRRTDRKTSVFTMENVLCKLSSAKCLSSNSDSPATPQIFLSYSNRSVIVFIDPC